MHFNRNKTAKFGTWAQGNFISVRGELTLLGAIAGQQSQELVLASEQFSPLLDLPLDGTEGPGQVPGDTY